MHRHAALLAVVLLAAQFPTAFAAASTAVIEDEAKVPAYTLPELLKFDDGRPVALTEQWREQRRPQLLGEFARHEYGRYPSRPADTATRAQWRVLSENQTALGGRATRRELALEYTATDANPNEALASALVLRFTVFTPNHRERAIPVFVGLHLFDTSQPQPLLAAASGSTGKSKEEAAADRRSASAAVTDLLMSQGYGVASLGLPELAPDSSTNWWLGAYASLPEGRHRSGGPPGPEETGALGLWAWGLSRALDYFVANPEFNGRGVIAIGHSRMGKAAIWAGANDERFAAVISNDSGCGGAALNRRIFGETVAIITRAFPHWFCGNFQQYAGHEDQLPVDQHQLLALIAPRPLYVASAEQDRWADPRGEYLATYHAAAAWRLLGVPTPGLSSSNPPPVNQPVGDVLRYHVRSGRHDLTEVDWRRYIEFARACVP